MVKEAEEVISYANMVQFLARMREPCLMRCSDVRPDSLVPCVLKRHGFFAFKIPTRTLKKQLNTISICCERKQHFELQKRRHSSTY